jgi:hypothetical protein
MMHMSINPKKRNPIMSLTKLVIATLLIIAQASVWANPANPHATPGSESTGTVIATEQADPYTYVQIEIEGENIWFAVPAATFTLGEEVFSPSGGLPMKDFYSKTLDRTFDMVYFAGSIKRVNAPEVEALPPGHPPIDEAKTPSPDEIDLSGIEPPEGGKTVAEIFREKDTLAGNPVLVRGKAVKVANGILGKNWIHLRDGSGENGSNDLTVTTTNNVSVGALITVKGILALDRDFGSGYKYDVLLENADIQTR